MSTSPEPNSTSSTPAAPPSAELDAMQALLAGEHSCVYGYGVVGAQLDGDAEDSAREGLEVHRARRDALEADIRALDAQPVAALPGYALPFPVTDAAEARQLAQTLEQRIQPLYIDLVGAAPDVAGREFAARAVVDAAARAAAWTTQTTAFPGLQDRAGDLIAPGESPADASPAG